MTSTATKQARDWRKPCRRKRGHKSQAEAEAHKNALIGQMSKYMTLRLEVIRCKLCGYWHLTVGIGDAE